MSEGENDTEKITPRAKLNAPYNGHVDGTALGPTVCAFCGLEKFDPYEKCPKRPDEEKTP